MEKIKKERIRKISIIALGIGLLIGIAGIFFDIFGDEKTAGMCLLLLITITAITFCTYLVLRIPGIKTNEEIANEW